MTDKGYALLEAASARATSPASARNLVDLVSAEDFAALGRVMNAVADHLVSRHPARRSAEPASTTLRSSSEQARDRRGRAGRSSPTARPPVVLAACRSAQSRVRRRWVTRCGRAASTPRRSILFSS